MGERQPTTQTQKYEDMSIKYILPISYEEGCYQQAIDLNYWRRSRDTTATTTTTTTKTHLAGGRETPFDVLSLLREVLLDLGHGPGPPSLEVLEVLAKHEATLAALKMSRHTNLLRLLLHPGRCLPLVD